VNVVCLSSDECSLLAARFAEHGNSHRRMKDALRETGAGDLTAKLDALRELERRFAVDLGSVCFRHARRDDAGTHPLERMIVDYVTETHDTDNGAELWVLLDRIVQVRELMEGRLVGEPES
jgi:hypothetical protein